MGKKHGGCGTRLYRIWKRIRTRCNNKNTIDYKKWYGSKGITICDEWSNFENFKCWSIVHGYDDNLTIDRIDNSKGYSPDNCRWVTHKDQSRNTSHNVNLTYNGETHCLAEWAEILNVKRQTLQQRYFRGWATEKILFQPIRQHRKKG